MGWVSTPRLTEFMTRRSQRFHLLRRIYLYRCAALPSTLPVHQALTFAWIIYSVGGPALKKVPPGECHMEHCAHQLVSPSDSSMIRSQRAQLKKSRPEHAGQQSKSTGHSKRLAPSTVVTSLQCSHWYGMSTHAGQVLPHRSRSGASRSARYDRRYAGELYSKPPV